MGLSPELRAKPAIITFAENAAMFFAGEKQSSLSNYESSLIEIIAYLPDKAGESGTNGSASKGNTSANSSQVSDAEAAGFDDTMSSVMFALTIPVDEAPKNMFECDNNTKWQALKDKVKNWSPQQ